MCPFDTSDGLPKILLFKGRGTVSSLIRWQTRGKYSHAAFLRPDGRIIESWMTEGVRIKKLSDWSNIDAFDIKDITEEQGILAMNYAQKQVGMKYDWWGVVRFVSRDSLPDAVHRWFCSELVYHSLSMAGVHLFRDTAAYEVSPDLLRRSLRLVEAERL